VRTLLVSGLALGALIVPAAAADMPIKALAPPPSAWTGFYAGVNAGYADLPTTVHTTAAGTPDAALGIAAGVSAGLAALSSQTIPLGNAAGFGGGGQIGYNLELDKLLVGGIEADIQGVSGHTNSVTTGGPVLAVPVTTTLAAKVSTSYVGTVRGRLGILLTPSWLAYVTGGLAYGGADVSTTLVQSAPNGFAGTGTGSFSGTRIGGAFGGGLEWMFARRWTTRVEYLHYDLGTASGSFAATSSFFLTPVYQNVTSSAHVQGNLVRAGVNYLF
jgi:outer membrane immunogenic protein